MHTAEKDLPNLPEDSASLKAMLCSLLAERDREKQRADDLHIQNLRLQIELARYKKWYYGPRADRLNSTSELTQVLLDFGQELEQRPIHPEDVPAASEPEYELRRVKRRACLPVAAEAPLRDLCEVENLVGDRAERRPTIRCLRVFLERGFLENLDDAVDPVAELLSRRARPDTRAGGSQESRGKRSRHEA